MKFRHPLRLPSREITGVVDPGLVPPDAILPIFTYASTGAKVWAGRPVGLAQDQGGYPIMWTLPSLAATSGRSADQYEAALAIAVAARPGLAGWPLWAPRAVIYSNQGGGGRGFDAALPLAAQLQSRGILAAIAASEFSCLSALTMPVAATGYTELSFSPADGATVILWLPDGTPSEWTGGEVLYLTNQQVGGLDAFSYVSSDAVVQEELTDSVTASQALYAAWAPRYARLRSHVVLYGIAPDTPEQASNNAYTRANHLAAIAGTGVTHDDLGDDFADEAEAAPAVSAAMQAVIEDFFDL